MGHYSYSPLRQKFTPEQVEAEIKTIVSECLPNVVPCRTEGVPISRGDDRKAHWHFMLTTWPKDCDAAFSMSLIKPGNRLKFKLPVSGDGQEAQRALRTRLVMRLNKA